MYPVSLCIHCLLLGDFNPTVIYYAEVFLHLSLHRWVDIQTKFLVALDKTKPTQWVQPCRSEVLAYSRDTYLYQPLRHLLSHIICDFIRSQLTAISLIIWGLTDCTCGLYSNQQFWAFGLIFQLQILTLLIKRCYLFKKQLTNTTELSPWLPKAFKLETLLWKSIGRTTIISYFGWSQIHQATTGWELDGCFEN